MKNTLIFILLISLIKRIIFSQIIIKDIQLKNNEFYFTNPPIAINNSTFLEIEISWKGNNNLNENNDILEHYLILESKIKENNIDIKKYPFFYNDKNNNSKLIINNKKEILLKNISFYFTNIDLNLNHKNIFNYTIPINNDNLHEDKFYFLLYYKNFNNNKNKILINVLFQSNETINYIFPFNQNAHIIILFICLFLLIINIIFWICKYNKNKNAIIKKRNSLIIAISYIFYLLYILSALLINKIFHKNYQLNLPFFYLNKLFLVFTYIIISFYYFLISLGFSLTNLQINFILFYISQI